MEEGWGEDKPQDRQKETDKPDRRKNRHGTTEMDCMYLAMKAKLK